MISGRRNCGNVYCENHGEQESVCNECHLAALREQREAIAKDLEGWAEETKAAWGADWIRSCAKYVRAFEPGKEDEEDGKE